MDNVHEALERAKAVGAIHAWAQNGDRYEINTGLAMLHASGAPAVLEVLRALSPDLFQDSVSAPETDQGNEEPEPTADSAPKRKRKSK
jgi:hypothetical protein